MITNTLLGQTGRLGNQMFEYALLLGVAAKRGYEVRVPKMPDEPGKIVRFELKYLNVTAREFVWDKHFKTLKKLYRQPHYHFDPKVFEQPDGTNYYGSFQSERYFDHCSELIRKEFRFRDDISQWAKDTFKKYREYDNVVALSVRRGDYVQHQPRFHLLSADYYTWAMLLLEEQLGSDCCYLIFSDDFDWCRANLKPPKAIGSDSDIFYCKYPSHWHQLALMALCDHHIVAGSSFSWWGAWLGKNKQQTVIAPEPWLGPQANGSIDNCEDVYAEGWQRLSVEAVKDWGPPK